MLRLSSKFYINVKNVVAIERFPTNETFEISTFSHCGDGVVILGTGFFNINYLKYKIKSEDEYKSLDTYLENSDLLKLSRDFYINMDNVVTIKHCDTSEIFELSTIAYHGWGICISASGGHDMNCLKYTIKSTDDRYNVLKNYLEKRS